MNIPVIIIGLMFLLAIIKYIKDPQKAMEEQRIRKEEKDLKLAERELKRIEAQDRKLAHREKLTARYTIKCPKCRSTNLQWYEKQKSSVVKGLIGGYLVGPAGLLAGVGTGKRKGFYKCMNCGKEFKK